jgi:urease accessory protein
MRWLVLQIGDSAFPTGGFAHSAGLEAIAHLGGTSSESLGDFACAHLWSVGSSSLPFVAAAHDAPSDVWRLDAELDAFLTHHVANRASRTQGRAFVATCGRVFESGPIADMASPARARKVAAHLAPIFGAILSVLHIDRREALELFLYLTLRNLTSAAVRLGLVGPHEAQRIHRTHERTLDDVLATCSDIKPTDAASTAPIADLMAATHDRLYTRIFQS